MEMIKLGVSACLLGEKVRYDGGHKKNPFIIETLSRQFELVSVCPEIECGLPVPREPMQLVGDPGSLRLLTIGTRIDRTDQLLHWLEEGLAQLEHRDMRGYIFKARSPSCAIGDAEVVALSGQTITKVAGLFARAVMLRFPRLPVIDEEGLALPAVRDAFLRRIQPSS